VGDAEPRADALADGVKEAVALLLRDSRALRESDAAEREDRVTMCVVLGDALVLGDLVVRQRPESLGEKLALGDDDGVAHPLLVAAGRDDGSALAEASKDCAVVMED